MAEIKISSCPPVSREAWDEWQMKFGTPFQTTSFMEAQNNLGWKPIFASILNNGVLEATATLSVRTVPKNLDGLSPFKWASFFSEISSVTDSASVDLLLGILIYLRRKKIPLVMTNGSMARFDFASVDQLSKTASKVIVEPFGTFEVDLTLSQEELWTRVHPKHRNVIRNAEKSGVTVREKGSEATASDIYKLYLLIKETLKRGGAGYPSEKYFINICSKLLQVGFARLFEAESKNGELFAGAIIPFSMNRAYYWFGGSLHPSEIALGTNNLLQWRAMLSMKEKGVQCYDFGGARPAAEDGSKIDKIQKYKARFGGKFVPCVLWRADLSLLYGPLIRKAKDWADALRAT